MHHSHKLVLNTGALYIKIIVNALVSLISTRIVLSCLGSNDYGLYNLIAGVIALFSFLNGSLMISSQRFLSIAIGEENRDKLCSIFNVSVFIHMIFAAIIGILLVSIQSFLFNGFLNIEESSKSIANIIYDVMILSSILTISTIPYSSIINAYEDMCFYSISEIISILFRLGAAIVLLYIKKDFLLLYTWLIFLSIFISFLTKYIWCKYKYKEVDLSFIMMKNKILFKEMIGFVAWNTLGSFAVLVRNQGVAVVLNIFFGTIVNAAYGIANQINALVLTFASTLTTVFTPSIIQSKGKGDNSRMLLLSIFSSKLSFLLSSMIALPLILFMPEVLNIWLKDVPSDTNLFCIFIIVSFIIMQMYPGINRSIYANGKIRGYQIAISITIVLNIPIGILLFKMGFPAYSILVTMAFNQLMAMAVTLYYAKKLVGLKVCEFVFRFVFPAMLLFMSCYLLGSILNIFIFKNINLYELILIALIYGIVYFVLYIIFILNENETKMIKSLILSLKNKIL